jgi:hypothetical protein
MKDKLTILKVKYHLMKALKGNGVGLDIYNGRLNIYPINRRLSDCFLAFDCAMGGQQGWQSCANGQVFGKWQAYGDAEKWETLFQKSVKAIEERWG